MSWKTLEPQLPETPLLWWVWKEHLGETLEGYWGGIHDHQTQNEETAKVLLVYVPESNTWYRAFIGGGLKRFPLEEIPTGARVRIKAYRQGEKTYFSVQYDPEDSQVLELPEEYAEEELPEL